MTRVAYDLRDSGVEGRFPAHGWAWNSQGVPLLWMPILRVLVHSREVARPDGTRAVRSEESLQAGYAAADTLDKLSLALSELDRCNQVAWTRQHGQGGTDGEWLTPEGIEALERIPLFIDLSFIYLRRLADQLTLALREFLFEHHRSAPSELKNLASLFGDQAALEDCNPLVGAANLVDHLQPRLGWLAELRRGSSNLREKGIRDLLEHGSTRMVVGTGGVGDGPMSVRAHLVRGTELDPTRELVSTLRGVCTGFAEFMTSLCHLARIPGPYDWLDVLRVDHHFVAFWPQLDLGQPEPPTC
jgi:hypothetical protein